MKADFPSHTQFSDRCSVQSRTSVSADRQQKFHHQAAEQYASKRVYFELYNIQFSFTMLREQTES
jgi:hypothetical protein